MNRNKQIPDKKRKKSKLLRMTVLMLVIAAFAFTGWRIYNGRQGNTKAARVMSSLENIIPGLGEDTGVSRGNGRDPLAAISLEGFDVVGVLEVPAIDVNAPVISSTLNKNGSTEGSTEPYFACWIEGSPVKADLMILGNRSDLFSDLSSLKPGERVSFTDIDGVRYNYRVSTQYHLKKWDKGNNDLMLCCESNSDTWFVVGCGTEN